MVLILELLLEDLNLKFSLEEPTVSLMMFCLLNKLLVS